MNFDLTYLTIPIHSTPPHTPDRPPSPSGSPPPPTIEKQPCGCRYNLTTRTMHVPCDAHKRCFFCRGIDLVFNSTPTQVKCPACGTKTTKGVYRR